jgi:hypothetical protein
MSQQSSHQRTNAYGNYVNNLRNEMLYVAKEQNDYPLNDFLNYCLAVTIKKLKI